MYVLGYDNKKTEQCNGCGKMAFPNDNFYAFVLPPSTSKITGKPDGVFGGIGSESQPNQLALLHVCPACRPKMLKAVDFEVGWIANPATGEKSVALKVGKFNDLTVLPPGPLREVLEAVQAKRKRNLH